jgi:septum formation topological specificity factor MinE
MNQDQEHDYAYLQDKLLMLVARRRRQQPNSEQIPKLDAEIAAVTDLLRSYRILKAKE